MNGPVCLVILDGFGLRGESDTREYDATALADTPFFDRVEKLYPGAQLQTSGRAVGLPDGQMGNSEVGHMTLGAGRVIEHDILRVQQAIDRGNLRDSAEFSSLLAAAATAGNSLHLLGLISNGGVHSSLGHLTGLLELLGERGIAPILHAFTDGRDTPPRSALEWLRPLEARLGELGGSIATVSGRYWAMDRDRRWDRVARAYRAIVLGEGLEAGSAVEAVEEAYRRDEGDEFIQPTIITPDPDQVRRPALREGAVGLFFNFRADRARELTNAITRTRPEELGLEIRDLPAADPGGFSTLTVYDEAFEIPALFSPVDVSGTLGELVSNAKHKQLRIAETEKYAHVTYFFNGGREEPFPGEDRILVPSPRDVATYDLKPEMSAVTVTDRLIDALDNEDYAFVLVNFANPDMVGHTGVVPACIRAVEVVDACLDRLRTKVLSIGGAILITADHGNIEQLHDPETRMAHTAHTTNPVPLWWVMDATGDRELVDGGLADIALSVCELLELEPAAQMTGRSLLRCEPNSSS